jgi:hypothetical protein
MRSSSRLALALVLALGGGAGAQGEVIERVLAVVDDLPILQSEVVALQRLRGLDGEAALSARIDEALMVREVRRLPEASVSAAEEERGLQSLRKGLDAQALQAIGEAELRHIARRQTAILKYIEFRFRPQIRVEDDEVRKLYQQRYGQQQPPPPFEAVAGELLRELQAHALDLRVESWISELRLAARIRRNDQSS